MANKFVSNLGGGMNGAVGRWLLKDGEFEIVKNYKLDSIGNLTKRPGFKFFGNIPLPGTGRQAAVQYNNTTTSANSTQVCVIGNLNSDSRPYEMEITTLNGAITTATTTIVLTDATNFDTSGTIEIEGDIINYTGKSSNNLTGVTNISTSHSSGVTVRQWRASHNASVATVNKSNLLTFVDYLFWFKDNGAPLSTNNPQSGVAWGTTNCPTGIAIAFGDVFQDRIYGGEYHGSRMYFSSLPSSTNTITWDTTNDWVDINPDDSDEITCIKTAGHRMLIFKNNGLFTWKYGLTQSDKVFDVGTPSDKTVKNIHGITFFANRYGAYAWSFDSQAQPTLISRKMQKFFDAISSSNLTKLNAGVDNNHYYLWIGNVTVDGVSYSDVVLTYHIFEDDWSFYTDIPSQVWADFKEGTTEFLSFSGGELSNNLGGSFWFNTGTTQPHKTLQEGSPVNIDGELISKEHVLSFPDESTVNYVDIVANTAIGTNAFYQLDRSGSFIPLGSLKGRVNGFRVGKAGQTIRLRLTDNSPSQSIIEAYNIEYEVNKKRVTFKQYG